jgi:hypothetical protein
MFNPFSPVEPGERAKCRVCGKPAVAEVMTEEGFQPVCYIHAQPINFDTITEAEAEAEIERLWEANPEVTEAIISAVEIASPTAGPIRILRELVSEEGR